MWSGSPAFQQWNCGLRCEWLELCEGFYQILGLSTSSTAFSTESPLPNKRERLDTSTKEAGEKLLCVSIVARHADRTPKQKMKMSTNHPSFLAFCDVKDMDEEVKMKQTTDLRNLLLATKNLLEESDSLSTEIVQKLSQLRQVLEMSPLEGTSFYRKVQLKPKKMKDGAVTEVLLILKWGGKLTWAGKTQSLALGHALRVRLYPSREGGSAGGSLLRLHATYRHDLKIYTSDEGRVVLSAAAFTKGLLDLESCLPPIASMMMQSDEAATMMLDNMPPEGRVRMDEVKRELSNVLHGRDPSTADIMNDSCFASKLSQLGGSPEQRMRELHDQLTKLVDEIVERQGTVEERKRCSAIVPHLNHAKEDPVENLEFLYLRWRKMEEDFYDKKRDKFDISKLPDIYDCSLYDTLHNQPLDLKCLPRLHEMAHALASFMVPLEYGITKESKSAIGISITRTLVRKLVGDLHKEVDDTDGAKYQLDQNAVNKSDVRNLDRRVHTRLYFTSESHIISLLNVVRWGHVRSGAEEDGSEPLISPEAASLFDAISADGMAFMTHLILTVHESPDYDGDSVDRFRVRILFSPGANTRELNVIDAVPLTPPDGLALSKVDRFFTNVLEHTWN